MEISAEFHLGSTLYEIHPQVINGWIVSLVLWVLLFLGSRQLKNADPRETPKGLALFLESFVTIVDHFVKDTMGERDLGFAPFIGSLVLFLSVANLLGLLGLEPPTTDVNVTFALAVFTIGMMCYTASKVLGGLGTLKELFFGEFPWLFPLEVISQLARPVSLAFRLFGALLSGTILLKLLYGALGWFSPVILPFLHIYFDLFEGMVQVLIFIMLAMIWTSMLVEVSHEK